MILIARIDLGSTGAWRTSLPCRHLLIGPLSLSCCSHDHPRPIGWHNPLCQLQVRLGKSTMHEDTREFVLEKDVVVEVSGLKDTAVRLVTQPSLSALLVNCAMTRSRRERFSRFEKRHGRAEERLPAFQLKPQSHYKARAGDIILHHEVPRGPPLHQTPSRPSRALREPDPELNNHSPFPTKPDVVVVGAGIVGLCYAIQLKKDSPELEVVVLEKSPGPCHKIGESTLSSFSWFVNGALVPVDYFFRLFALKDGLQFYCIDQEGKSVTCEDVGGHDVSFQMDRRVSELFFTMWAQHKGIHVVYGVDADFALTDNDDSSDDNISAPKVVLKRPIPGFDGTALQPRVACDASGFSRRLTSKVGRKQTFEGWNCDAYWAYFKERPGSKAEDRVAYWDYPSTNHMCFPEGWGWFIKLISWHHAPLPKLMDIVAHLIDLASRGVPADQVPCTRELGAVFDCPHEYITSIGWAVRNDYEFTEDLSMYGDTESEQKFLYFQRKYPTLDRLMTDVYELLPNYYERTYFIRKALAYRSPVVAGKGWFAIGNSAGFTNPLISPGMNAGIEAAYLAASLSAEFLQAPAAGQAACARKCIDQYQAWSHEYMMPNLHRMNTYWYTMFRDHRLFDAMLPCFWATGVGAVDDIQFRPDSEFGAADLGWLVGSGLSCFQDFAKAVLEILDPEAGVAPLSKRITDEQVERVRALSREMLARRAALFPQNKWGCYLRKYNHQLQRVPENTDRYPGGTWSATHCVKCDVWIHDRAEVYPVCGAWQSEKQDSMSIPSEEKTWMSYKGAPAAWLGYGVSFLLGAAWTMFMVHVLARNSRFCGIGGDYGSPNPAGNASEGSMICPA
ncbi:hypothetical protein F4778DRAFT_732383 [Xylariomycetidae sp. FL2044]|nr:hypothetical protein F4778DRAFT_732383 [Xylariomycetidae sp. FL2044]